MKKSLSMLLFALLLVLGNQGLSASSMQVKDLKSLYISYGEAKKLHSSKSALFIDARGYKLFQRGTIMGSVNVPTKLYSKLKKFLPADKGATIVSYCNGLKCEKSDELAEMLIHSGYSNVLIYKGGYPEWKKNKQAVAGLMKECADKPKGKYAPKGPSAMIHGTKIYSIQDEDGQIDQFWFAPMVENTPKAIQIVDLRKAVDFKISHLKGAINVPFNSKKSRLDESKLPKDKVIVFYCNTGMMSIDAYGYMEKTDRGNKDVFFFDANIVCEGSKCKATPNDLI